jgi:hypothetical protein
VDAINYFRCDDLADIGDEPLFGCPFPSPTLPGPVVTDPQFVAVVDTMTMMHDMMAAAAFMQGMRAASERRPYVAVVGSRNAIRHSLHQTGVL